MQLLDHFSELTIYPENAKKLRELVLQLAVKGKLTESWRASHPDLVSGSNSGQALLKKILAEKAQLIQKGKIKKEKPLPPIADNEIPNYLPKGWAYDYFRNITTVITCGMASTPQYTEAGKVFLSAKNVKPFLFKPDDHKFVSFGTYEKITKNAKPELGDILLTRVGAGIGEACVIDKEIDFAFYVSLTLIKPLHEFLNSYYLLFWLSSKDGIGKVLDNIYGKGVSQGNLNVNQVRQFVLPIPPLEEQKAIVARVDTLMKEIDALEQLSVKRIERKNKFVASALHHISTTCLQEMNGHWDLLKSNFRHTMDETDNVKKLRETILQLAVQGKLTRSFREQNPDLISGSNSATALLEKIKAEKARLIQEGNIKKEKPLPPITDDEIPYDLPEEWVWCRFQDLIKDLRYGTSKKCDYGLGKNPVLRIPNISNGRIDLTDLKSTDLSENEALDLSLNHGDILLIRSNGSVNLVGKSAVINDIGVGYSFAGYLVRARVFHEEVMTSFLHLMLESPFIRQSIEKPIRTTSGVKNINSTEISQLLIALPPIAEQKNIVEKVNQLMALCDQLEQHITDSQHLAEDLMKSLVREVVEV